MKNCILHSAVISTMLMMAGCNDNDRQSQATNNISDPSPIKNIFLAQRQQALLCWGK